MTLQTETVNLSGTVLANEDLIERFVRDCQMRGLSPESIRSYESSLKIISGFLESKSTSFLDVNKERLREILTYLSEERGVSPKTLENNFTALSSLFQFLAYEGLVKGNPVIPFRKRYLHHYKNPRTNSSSQRRAISVEEMSDLINSILDSRDKAIVTLLAKTGIRRGELIDIDLDDIDWREQSIRLKPKSKRSNRIAFFDDECARVLQRWLRARKNYEINPECKAFFVGEHGGRLKRHGVYSAVTKHAERIGLHNPKSPREEDHFTPHYCRHWFTTHLRRNGMKREYIKELRGDSRNEAMDIYYHIDRDELRRSYLANIPTLGID